MGGGREKEDVRQWPNFWHSQLVGWWLSFTKIEWGTGSRSGGDDFILNIYR